MRYRRAWLPGGSYFFTVVTADRQPLLANEAAIALLRRGFRRVRERYTFTVDAMVVLPDHLHCIWTLPPGDADFATRWRLIKTWFTKHYGEGLDAGASGYAALTRPTRIWQNRYWEHVLRDDRDYERHADYIHYNPVKHGLVASAADWPFSSFNRFAEAGLYPPNWGQGGMTFEGIGHE
jgi:putative transposase